MLGEFRVNSTTDGDQIGSTVMMDGLGNFVISWSSFNQDAANSWGVYARKYLLATGLPLSGEFRVNSTTAGDQKLTGAAMDASGRFVIVWTSSDQDGSSLDIYGQSFDLLGLAVRGEFRVNSTTAGDQIDASVTRDDNGGFIVAWASNGQDGNGWGVYGQQFSAFGIAIEGEFLVNTTTEGDQMTPVMAMDNVGHLTVAWSGNGRGDADGIFFRRYAVNTASEIPPAGDTYEPEGHTCHTGCDCPICTGAVSSPLPLGNEPSVRANLSNVFSFFPLPLGEWHFMGVPANIFNHECVSSTFVSDGLFGPIVNGFMENGLAAFNSANEDDESNQPASIGNLNWANTMADGGLLDQLTASLLDDDLGSVEYIAFDWRWA